MKLFFLDQQANNFNNSKHTVKVTNFHSLMNYNHCPRSNKIVSLLILVISRSSIDGRAYRAKSE